MINEIKQDIFKWIESNREESLIVLMHCISSDWALGAGIAKTINDIFQVKDRLKMTFDQYWTGKGYSLMIPILTLKEVSPHLHICNLVTKERYWNKPTYETLHESIESAKPLLKYYISFSKRDNLGMKIVMPKIGCGLDKLDWETVRRIIEEQLSEFDVTVCYLK